MPDLIGRHKRLSFLKVKQTYMRMTKFTSLNESKSPKEYTRQYVDRSGEDTDVVGYSSNVAFSFDRHTDTPVHDKLADIIDNEKLGTDAHVDIVTVDLFKTEDNEKTCEARMREYAVVPSNVGDGTDALIYAGSFKAVSDMVTGTATSEDNWETCTFTPKE